VRICIQCGRKGLLLRTARVQCELNGGKLPLSPRSGGDGSGVRVEACSNSGDYCEDCFRSVQTSPILLSLFDEEAFLGGMKDEFQAWLHDPSKKERLVTHVTLCTPKCLRTLFKGRARTRVVRGESEVRWVVKVSAQSFIDRSGNRLRHVSLFWYGDPGAHAMPGGMVVRHCLPTKEACQVFDEEFGGPLAPPRPARGRSVPDQIEESDDAEVSQTSDPASDLATATHLAAARDQEEAGNWDGAIRSYALAQMPEEIGRVRNAKAGALAGAGRFKEAAEVYDLLGKRAEAKAMRKRDFEAQAAASGFGKEENATVLEDDATVQKQPEAHGPAPSSASSPSPGRRAGLIVCPSCKKLLGRGLHAAVCPNCGAALVTPARAP